MKAIESEVLLSATPIPISKQPGQRLIWAFSRLNKYDDLSEDFDEIVIEALVDRATRYVRT